MRQNKSLTSRKIILNELNSAFNGILHNHKYLNKESKKGEAIIGSGEWLLDNIYLIEKEYKSIKLNLPIEYFNNLPREELQGDDVPRIYQFAKLYINECHGAIKEDDIIYYMKKSSIIWDMGEIWAFPLMLRIALIINLAEITNAMTILQKQRTAAVKLANTVIDAYSNGKEELMLKKLEAEYTAHYDKVLREDPYKKYMGDSVVLHDGLFSSEFINKIFTVLKDNSIEDEKIYNFILERAQVDRDIEEAKNNETKNESAIENSISAIITSLRIMDSINWKEFFEETSQVERLLKEDPAKAYEVMDFKSKDYYRHKVEKISRELKISEIKLVNKILELSKDAKDSGKELYKCHVGYYIVDKGLDNIRDEFKYPNKINYRLSPVKYILLLILVTISISIIALNLGNVFNLGLSRNSYIIAFLILIIPASEITSVIVNRFVSKFLPPSHIPKFDYSSGIPKESKTIVAIPAIINSADKAKELIEKLEVYYLGNRDNNLYFVILGDFKDSKKEIEDKDELINKEALKAVKLLNNKYFKDKEEHFYYLNRKRLFNKSEKIYMGYERKRGKIMEFIALIKGELNTTFNAISGDIIKLKAAKYLITLDTDTFLPMEAAKKMISAMDHPLNIPYIDKGIVKRGYGIMQPKVTVTLEGKNRTNFSKIFAGEAGVDGYSIAASDTYQDLFDEGIFTGKGIINIDAFYTVLKDEIKENRILSHDLLEGAYARCALLTDVEVIDGYPSYYLSSSKRLHRWVRGDWQLIGWLFNKKITLLSKWKIIDNLRRSLLAPAIIIGLLVTLTLLQGKPQIALILLLAIILPLLFTITDFVVTPKNKLMGTIKTFKQIILILSFTPYQGYLMLNAILKTLFRLTVSKKNLLQWQTAEEVERSAINKLTLYYKEMWISPIIAGIVFILAFNQSLLVGLINTPVIILWLIAPYLAWKISKPIINIEDRISIEDEEFLRELSRSIWAYYEDFVNDENNYLAPDNYQEKPYKGVAHRTSPTNIGMGLMSNIVAYDLGFISQGYMISRLENIVHSMKKLQKYNGHLLNWYNTKTLEPLWPRYVSTVDSGNLLGYLMIISKELEELKNKPIIRENEIRSFKYSYKRISEEDKIELIDNLPDEININEYKLLLNEELKEVRLGLEKNKEKEHYWLKKLEEEIKNKIDFYNYIFDGVEDIFIGRINSYKPVSLIDILEVLKNKDTALTLKNINKIEEYLERIDDLNKDIKNIINQMNFKVLFNEKRGLFSIGYNIEENSLGNSYYDLLASEARIASFLAIARGEVPMKHWYNLSRNMTKVYGHKSLVSWSGTMFEYFMPFQIMKNYKETIWDMTYSSVVKAQIIYGEKKKVPWGISESAFYEFDIDQNYQYRAFGVPGIGLKRGLENELVVSPYSSIMTLPKAINPSLSNLKKLKESGAFGKYGYIEAIDFTEGRGNEKEIRCYMVHHLGMSLLALDNVINNNILQKRFHSIPEVKATEILLKEKIPQNITFDRPIDVTTTNKVIDKEHFVPRIFKTPLKEDREVLLLSNGSYSTMINIDGSGYSKKNEMTINRWKGDSTSDSTGIFLYIKDLDNNKYWSATYEPCKVNNDSYGVEFDLNKAVFYLSENEIESKYEIFVSPEDDTEIRKITIKNTSTKEKNIELTSYMEVTLSSFEADVVHPSFLNLFITTEYEDEINTLIANRRARSKNEKIPYLAQGIYTENKINLTYETSRINFIGRNNTLTNPDALKDSTPLKNTIGTVLDPIFSLRGILTLKENEECVISFITTVDYSKEAVIEKINKYRSLATINKVYDECSYYNSLELKYIGIKSAQANIYQTLASNILYLNTNRKSREEYIKKIAYNQEDLWAYGISGDLPIVMTIIRSEEDIDFLRQVINMHYYWRVKGLKTDLLIYNFEKASYDEPLQKNIGETIRNSMEKDNVNKPAGLFIHNSVTMNENIRDFIIGICKIFLDPAEGSILKQINKNNSININYIKRNMRYEETLVKSMLVEDSKILKEDTITESINLDSKYYDFDCNNFNEKRNNEYRDDRINIEKLDFYNGYGGFCKETSSYIIKLSNFKNTPAPWINVISNEDFGFHISEAGSGYTWCENSRENKITPWSNDWVMDSLGEALYIRDDKTGECFSITPKPIRDGGDYIIEHGFGYSNFKHTAYDIRGEMLAFCPKGEKLKLYKISLENMSSEDKELSLFYYAQLVLGVHSYSTAKYISTYIDGQQYIWGQNPYSKYFGKDKVYLTLTGASELNFSGNRREFIGSGNSLENPLALKRRKLSNTSGSIYDPCLSLQGSFIIKAKEVKELTILFGSDRELENVDKIINKYKNVENVNKEFEKVKEYWNNLVGAIKVETPDKSMNYLLNGWLMYQNISCRYLSRTAFYQSGGAYGFRDQLQDSMSIGILNSKITREQILRSASRQYVEGDVQHWWHPVVNAGIRTRFSDDLLWLPYVTIKYLKTTGDYSILDETVEYLEDEPLKPGEDERYTIVNNTTQEGTIYEHCIKAINKALSFGAHNIPLMGSGDWNDGMSTVGNEGKGESVWLGWFLYSILDDFIQICKNKNDNKTEDKYIEYREFLKSNLNTEAWDGNWYKRAFFDNGEPLGSVTNDECKIDSLAQSWSIISNAGDKEKSLKAMNSLEKYLIDRDKGMILLLYPPFDKSKLEPGYIKGYVPGVRENGGQYTHAAVWVILAFTMLEDGNKAWEYYNMINPINHSNTEIQARNYKVEPYVMSADVYIKSPHAGRGGWSWYTGAAGWMYKVGIENILGFKEVEGKGYTIEPCVPDSWNEYSITLNKENLEYYIKVKKSETKLIIFDGERIRGNIIPKIEGKHFIEVWY